MGKPTNMRAEYVLILGSLGFGMTVAYAIWSEARVWILKADLLNLRAELLEAMRSNHREWNLHNIVSLISLNTVIKWAGAGVFSFPPGIWLLSARFRRELLLFLNVLNAENGSALRALRGAERVSLDHEMFPEAARATARGVVVLLIHQLTTISGLFLGFFLLLLFGKGKLTEWLTELLLASQKPETLVERFLRVTASASKPLSS
jgi:hypothetical protein